MAKKNKLSDQLKDAFKDFSTKLSSLDNEDDILKLKYNYITLITNLYKVALHKAIDDRIKEMDSDLNEHFIIYKALGIHEDEHILIDRYQNIGRFIFKYAGALLEDIAKIALGGQRVYIPNVISSSPKKFEIDCYTEDDNKAHEIKWRDATTDGDHAKKEENKVKGIVDKGYTPVRVMFFMPQREQAVKIQKRITELYQKDGEAYIGDRAFEYVKNYSKIDIKDILQKFIDSQEDFLKFS